MNEDRLDPSCIETAETSIRPDLLVSAVLHLMSNYSANSGAITVANDGLPDGCPGFALVIERHLKTLACLPTLAARTSGNLPTIGGTMGRRGQANTAKAGKIIGVSALADESKRQSGLTSVTRCAGFGHFVSHYWYG